MTRPAASVSLDLDNLWSYLKTQGAAGWESYPSYLDRVVPRILALLEGLDQRITVFVVGRDASRAENAEALRSIADAGHEIGNHSYQHEPWLHLYDRDQLHEEIDGAALAIEAATGQVPRGFRGPGFSTSPLVREVLQESGYDYDASLFPSCLGPLSRLFFFLNARHLDAEEKERRKGLYGKFSDAFGELKPFSWPSGLIEVPVTTMPLLRLPIHTTYLMFLAQVSPWIARRYWDTAMLLCRLRGVAPSLLLHPTDFLDQTDVPAMGFFPGMKVPADQKIALVEYTLRSLQRHWATGPMAEQVRSITQPLSTTLSTQPV